MNDSVGPLCCCEYYDINDQRNHILGCCCNCVDLDEAFENVISGRSVPLTTRMGLKATFLDRLRIPWRGGAKQVAFDAILPLFILPLMFLLASISLWWTIFSFTTVIVFVAYIFNFLIRTVPCTKFFFVWTITSMVILYMVFEFVVIPFLEILIEENIALSIFICGFVLSWYFLKVRNTQIYRTGEREAESGGIGKSMFRLQNCSICQVAVPDKDHHCVWLDSCIGRHNQCLFIMALLFAVVALVYSSNLTLTSVCHPFIFYKSILMPDDCSDVYQEFELSLSFVSALYSLGLAVILLLILLHQILLVSIGVSGKEWRNFPLSSKCFLGLTANRPQNLGFLRNWSRIICWNRNHGSYITTSN